VVPSHFGGLPSLSRETEWPVWDRHDYLIDKIERWEKQFKANPRATGLRDIASQWRSELTIGPLPLAFLAQLSISEIYSVAPIPGWPKEGTLVFFYDAYQAWGFNPLERGHCRVLYFPVEEDLAAAATPKDLPDEAKFPHRKLGFKRDWTLPTHFSEDETTFSVWRDDGYGDLCRQLMGSSSDDRPIHRCGGHPQEVQGEMRLECQLVTNGIYCGDSSGYTDPRRSTLEKGVGEWDLLLQVDSDENLGWMWGDAGRVYFWARQQDIAASDFDGSWAILQCY
jgi:uncharacterized protein YwqG